MLALGFPIRVSAGHRLFSASPRLIAAVHALHRLLVPRHPPCALPILTVITRSTRKGRTRGDTRSHRSRERCFVGMIVQFSRSAKRRRTPGSRTSGLSKLNSMNQRIGWPQVRSTLGTGSSSRRAGCTTGLRRRSKSWSFPRKEVIQPHLPVRLPCYDFTPVTSPTFDSSLPCGLGHRLRVLLASMV